MTLEGCRIQFNQTNQKLEVAPRLKTIQKFLLIPHASISTLLTDLITLGAQRIKLKELSSLDEFIRVISELS